MKFTEYLGAVFIGMTIWFFIATAIDKYFPDKPTQPPPHQRIIIQGSHDNIVWFTIDSLLIPTK